MSGPSPGYAKLEMAGTGLLVLDLLPEWVRPLVLELGSRKDLGGRGKEGA